jgi:hypothetical protein
MIFYRTLLDELRRDDQFCDCCGLRLRARMIEAAQQGDRNWIFCQECRRRWTPSLDIDAAARGWVLVFATDDGSKTDFRAGAKVQIPAAILCADCAASHPEPASLPSSIARLVLEQSRGPVQ